MQKCYRNRRKSPKLCIYAIEIKSKMNYNKTHHNYVLENGEKQQQMIVPDAVTGMVTKNGPVRICIRLTIILYDRDLPGCTLITE